MADDNFKKNKKDAEDYYQTQLRIAKVIKEQTESFSTYADAVSKVRENAKSIKETQKEIVRLTTIGTKEARAQAEVLKKEVDYLVQVNKELVKVGPLMRATGKSIASWGMEKLVGLGKNLLETYNRIDGSARRTTIQMGMSYRRMEQFRNVSIKAADDLALMGIHGEKAGMMLASFADSTGRQLMLTEESIIGMGALSKRTGMAEEEVAAMAGQMESFGLSSNNSVGMMEEIADISDKMGVNTSKIMKKVQQNIGMLNRLSFKDGVKGMARMAMHAEKYKLSMESSAGFAEKVMRPEGAIEAAASLQVLGGSLAGLGDPFKLMAEARNDPEAFAKSITKAASATAEWDGKEFKVSAYELERLREVSEVTGVSLDELVQTAKQGAKINMFEDALKVSGDDKEFLSSIMDADQMGAFIVDTEGTKQYLKDLSATQQQGYAQQLRADKDGSLARQKSAQTTQELISNTFDALQTKFLPILKDLDDKLRPSIEKLSDSLLSFVDKLFGLFNGWIPKLILALMAFAVGWPILKGLWSVMSTFWTVGKGLFGRGGGMASQLIGSAGGQGKFYKGGQFMPGGGRAPKGGSFTQPSPMGAQGAQGAGAMGQSAGSQATNMIAGAAAILILAAALFVFAKALQEFEKLQNGWGTLLLAAGSLIVLGVALKLLSPTLQQFGTQSWPGIAAMGALALSVTALGYATTLFAQGGLTGTLLMVAALIALTGAVLILGMLGVAGVGWIGVALVLALGAAMVMLGVAVLLASIGIAKIVDSFTNLFAVVNLENMAAMMMFGPALGMMAIGIFALAGSLVALGAAYLMGGFMGIFALAETGEEIQKAFKGIDTKSLAVSVVAINNLDMKKVQALKEMAMALSMASMFGGGMKINFGDIDVSGTITLKSGSGVSKSTDWVNDPIFVSKLKNLVWESMAKGKKGGKV